MSHLFTAGEPVIAHTVGGPPDDALPDRSPLRGFTWRGRFLQVHGAIDAWKDTGRWWEGEPEKWFWRLRAADREGLEGVYDLFFEPATGTWALYRIHD